MRAIVAAILIAVGFTACQPVPMIRCKTVYPSADIAPRPPDNVNYAHNVWTTNDGKVFGYSMEEDSTIWNTLACARYDLNRNGTVLGPATNIER